VATERFTLHRRAWRAYRRLPALARIGIAIVAIVVVVEFALLSRASMEQAVRAAVAAAVREATGPDPGSSCAALSPAGLNQVLTQFGGREAPRGAEAFVACRQLVASLRNQASAQQLDDFAHGGVRSVQFRSDGSAVVVYLAHDRRLGAELTMSDHGGRWLIDRVAAGELAPTQ
jgi:hypothetical protein